MRNATVWGRKLKNFRRECTYVKTNGDNAVAKGIAMAKGPLYKLIKTWEMNITLYN